MKCNRYDISFGRFVVSLLLERLYAGRLLSKIEVILAKQRCSLLEACDRKMVKFYWGWLILRIS